MLNEEIRLVYDVGSKKTEKSMNILFLGYDEHQTSLIKLLNDYGHIVWHTEKKITDLSFFDLVISHGYRHIFKINTINSSKRKIINLHIAYLPFNRGAHPNFWSFFDDTPSGVTIHFIDEGIDTGEMLFQKKVIFNNQEKTFEDTHKRLIEEIEILFQKNIISILNNTLFPIKQKKSGTIHYIKDLPREFNGWESSIDSEIKRLKSYYKKVYIDDLQVLEKLEKTREINNTNWMNLVRLVFRSNPIESTKNFKTKENLKTSIVDNNFFEALSQSRKKNNINLMKFLKLGLKNDPQATKKILSLINYNDKKINKILKEFY